MLQSPEKDYDVVMRRGYNDGNEGLKDNSYISINNSF
jgi:hypothetical protein